MLLTSRSIFTNTMHWMAATTSKIFNFDLF